MNWRDRGTIRRVGGFRALAVAYGLGVVLIAPQWLSAEGVPVRTPLVKVPAIEVPVTQPAAKPAPAAPAPAQPAQADVPPPPPDPAPQPGPTKPAPAESQQPAPAAAAPAPAPAAAPAAPDEPTAPATEGAIVVAQEDTDETTGSGGDAARDDKPEARLAQDERKKKKGGDEPVATTAATVTVRISDFKFTPKTVTINEGDTVTWVNDGPTLHTATAEDGSFDTGNLERGESGSATFDTAGTISYICTPHPFMKGTVIVRAAASGDDTDTGAVNGEQPTDTTAADTETAGGAAGLAATGTESALIALLGAFTLGTGILLRRRSLPS